MSRAIDDPFQQYCIHGNLGNFSILWDTNECRVGLNTYVLTDYMMSDIERCLREQLPRFGFYEDFYDKLKIIICSCSYLYEKFFKKYEKYLNKNKKFEMEIDLEYTCFCSNYGTPGVTVKESFYINWTK